ncbi:MAG: carbonic anhydrase [Chitinispirillaceae bacterium]|nr:carbonic anhydrase [Chitinispirillaceae bacterium]
MNAQESLARLFEGNRRFAGERMEHPRLDLDRRNKLLLGQNPFAAILCCSDSRVPPELLFDQGLGDLFTVRLAGNVLDDMAIASLEYAADHLHVPLIMVLGHSSCGAINAALADKGDAPGRIASLIDAIKPAIAAETPGASAEAIARTHARSIAATLRACKPLLSALAGAGKLLVVPAFYDMETGTVGAVE